MSSGYNLPPEIAQAYPYIAMHDLLQIGRKFDPLYDQEAAEESEAMLSRIQIGYAPPLSSIYDINTSDIISSLNHISVSEIERTDANVGIVHLDKHVGLDRSVSQYFRLDVSRNNDDKLISRLGSKSSIEEQIDSLKAWIEDGAYDEIVFMDDVLAFGSTLPSLIEMARINSPNTRIRVVVAIAATGGIWRGIEVLQEKCDVTTECLTKVHASPKVDGGSLGMAVPPSGDLTIFGGKVGVNDMTKTPINSPYILPFSIFKSIFSAEKILDASLEILDFNHDYVRSIEKCLGRRLLLADAHDAGFGTPTSKLERLNSLAKAHSKDASLHEVIDYYRVFTKRHVDLIEEEVATT